MKQQRSHNPEEIYEITSYFPSKTNFPEKRNSYFLLQASLVGDKIDFMCGVNVKTQNGSLLAGKVKMIYSISNAIITVFVLTQFTLIYFVFKFNMGLKTKSRWKKMTVYSVSKEA